MSNLYDKLEINRWIDRQLGRYVKKDRYIEIQIKGQRDRSIDIQRKRQIEKEIDRERDIQRKR